MRSQSSKIGDAVEIKKQYIDEEIERLASLPAAPANGRRVSMITNPVTGVGDGLGHSIGVSLCVLKPGERTKPIRHNSSNADFCIRGGGKALVGDSEFNFTQYDLWTTPGWTTYEIENNTNEIQVRLSYSNAPLLEKLAVHVIEEEPKPQVEEQEEKHVDAAKTSPYGTFQITPDGAWLMPYEKLIRPGFY